MCRTMSSLAGEPLHPTLGVQDYIALLESGNNSSRCR
jgi:hypothetical protein